MATMTAVSRTIQTTVADANLRNMNFPLVNQADLSRKYLITARAVSHPKCRGGHLAQRAATCRQPAIQRVAVGLVVLRVSVNACSPHIVALSLVAPLSVGQPGHRWATVVASQRETGVAIGVAGADF